MKESPDRIAQGDNFQIQTSLQKQFKEDIVKKKRNQSKENSRNSKRQSAIQSILESDNLSEDEIKNLNKEFGARQYLEQQEKIKAKKTVGNPSMVEYKMEDTSLLDNEVTPRVEEAGFDADAMFLGKLTPNSHFSQNQELMDRHSNIERIRKSLIG